jgi:2'-deoxynucleoside 5'-phosphate N-hydrolase
MVNIYFAGSIRGGRDDLHIYQDLIKFLATKGTVLTEHIGHQNLLNDDGAEHNKTDRFIWERDMEWLHSSNVIVAEVTQPSLGVGYELGIAEKSGIPVVLLYRTSPNKSLSAMLSGNVHFEKNIIYYKTVDEACAALEKVLPTVLP